MSEKHSEFHLQNLLIKEKFNEKNLYYNIHENNILKNLFKNCSKSGKKFGIPDRIYFDNDILIIFECKFKNLNNAIKDIEHYIFNLQENNYKIFGVAFIDNMNYKIFEFKDKKLINIENAILNLKTFKLEKFEENKINMNTEIHKIHKYIRENTKISNEHKSLFIAIILISLKFNWINNIIDNLDSKLCIYDILYNNLKIFNIDTNIFNIIKSSNDIQHLYNLIKQIKNIYDKNPSIDLLNEFYSEFVKYSNTDSKSLGIVLTPPHIVKLMLEQVQINENDIVLDLCAGTGSFLLEALKYNPKKIIGCEFQNNLFELLKCNIILRDLENDKYTLYKDNCFNHNFEATKSIINPPYSCKSEPEMKFLIKQLESIKNNGECCAIIPIGKLTNNKRNNKFKQQILNMAYIKTIIICRKSLFYPTAMIQCCIVHLIKKINNDIQENDLTNIIDYTNDGFIFKKNLGLIKTNEFESFYLNLQNNIKNRINLKKLTHDNDWTLYTEKKILALSNNESTKQIELYKLDLEYQKRKIEILNMRNENILENYYNYKISDIFKLEYISKTCKISENFNVGVYPLVSASKLNNGIIKYINLQENKTLNKGHCLIFSTVGTCFYQKYNFYGTSSIKILRPIIDITEDKLIHIALLLTNEYLELYNKNRGFKYEIFKNNIIGKSE